QTGRALAGRAVAASAVAWRGGGARSRASLRRGIARVARRAVRSRVTSALRPETRGACGVAGAVDARAGGAAGRALGPGLADTCGRAATGCAAVVGARLLALVGGDVADETGGAVTVRRAAAHSATNAATFVASARDAGMARLATLLCTHLAEVDARAVLDA